MVMKVIFVYQQGAANRKVSYFKRGGVGGGVGSGMGSGNFSSTFVLGTLEAGKHDVNNVNNVQCLITVSIGEILSPGEETRAAASISVHSYTDARDARHSIAQISTRDPPNKFSVRGRLQFSDPERTSS